MVSRKYSKRKFTGGVYNSARQKKKDEKLNFSTHTKVDKEDKRKDERVLGGKAKQRLLNVSKVNLADGTKHTQAKIKNVAENPANRNFIRQNIVTKGAVVETDKGKAKITSRPGQQGVANGVLVKEQKNT